jgi:DNA-3-methyladenine glycosylase
LAVDPERRLSRSFFERETIEVAKSLLGSLLVHRTEEGVAAGRVVETEAYSDATDLASHAVRLKNGGVQSMWGPAGIAYVYRSYGIHVMLNIVAKAPGETGAVLIRAVEPVVGCDLMRARRGTTDDRKLTNGPGNVGQALGIQLTDLGTDLTESDRLWIQPGTPPSRIAVGERIGISRSTELPWRFFDPDSRFVSAHRRGIVS